MNDRDDATRLIRLLDEGLRRLDGRTAGELKARRHRALAGEGAARPLGGDALGWGAQPGHGIAAVLIGVIALALAAWWASRGPTAQDSGEVDIRLLTDDLPPNAYLDKDFPAWRRLPGLCRS